MNQQMDKQLPEGWETTQLAEVADIILGQSPDGKTVNSEGKGIVFYQGKAEFGLLHPTPRNYCTNPKKIAKENDILLSVRAPVGPTNLANQETAIGRGLAAIRETQITNFKFILFYFRNIEQWLSQQGTGTTFQAISGQFIRDLPFPLPPLAEQHYLADKLDSLLARIQTVSEQLAAVPALLKQFRQSVLADAVSGKLTAEWREENQEAFPQMVTIAEVADFSIKKQKLDDDLPVSFSSMHYMSEKTGAALGFEEKKWGEVKKGFTYFENNDVLLAKITPCFENGKTAVARNLINGIGTGSTEFMVMRPNEGLLPDYLLFNINTNNFRRDGATNMTGSVGHKRVPKDFVENWPILLPSLDEQTEIVRRVEALFALADQIEQQSRAAAERVALLTQSVLAKAFRGELSAQWRCEHPDLISGDNSAAALLARIQAEREATGKKSRRA